jgi:hypothetical protein
MIWLNPAALVGLAALAAPLLIHLLVRRHAVRVLFPSLRFLVAGSSASVRLRRIEDWRILGLRLLALALAAAALAQPVSIGPADRARWRTRTSRAIVVDAGRGMESPRPDGGTDLDAARTLAERERQAAWQATVIEAVHLGRAVRTAALHLRAVPPSRREIVIVSAFPAGVLESSDFAAVDPAIGLRFLPVGPPPAQRRVIGVPSLAASAPDGVTASIVRLDGERTAIDADAGIGIARGQDGRVVISLAGGSRAGGVREAAAPRIARLVLTRERAAAEAAWAAVLAAGAPAPIADRAMAVLAGEAARPEVVRALAGGALEPWMADLAQRMRQDEDLARAARAQDGDAARLTAEPGLEPVARDAAARAIVHAAPWNGRAIDEAGRLVPGDASARRGLLLVSTAPAESLVTPTLFRAMVRAAGANPIAPDLDILRISDATLARWSRPAGEPDPAAVRHERDTDARWFWVAVLIVLAVEMRMRRAVSSGEEATRAHAQHVA